MANSTVTRFCEYEVKNYVLLPGERNTFLIFTKPGKHTSAHPCTVQEGVWTAGGMFMGHPALRNSSQFVAKTFQLVRGTAGHWPVHSRAGRNPSQWCPCRTNICLHNWPPGNQTTAKSSKLCSFNNGNIGSLMLFTFWSEIMCQLPIVPVIDV